MGNCLVTKLAEAVDIDNPIYIDGSIVYFYVDTANAVNSSVVCSGKFKLELLDGDAYFTNGTSSTTSIGTVLNFDSRNNQSVYADKYIPIVANRTGYIRAKMTYVEGFNVRKIGNLMGDIDDMYEHQPSGTNLTLIAFNKGYASKFTSSVDKLTPLTEMRGSLDNSNAMVNIDIDHFINNTVAASITCVKNYATPNITITGSILNMKSTALTMINFHNNNHSGITLTGSLEDWAAQQVSLGRTSGSCVIRCANTGVTFNGQRLTTYSKTVTFSSSGYTIS